MEEVIKGFKVITDLANKTESNKITISIDDANEIVKYIDTLEAKNETLEDKIWGLEDEISTLEEENSNLLEMVES